MLCSFNINCRKSSFFIFITLICITSSSMRVNAQNPDFSGTWSLNREKTDFGELSENSTPLKVTVSQSKDSIRIERLSKNGQGETNIYIETLPFNGKVQENLIKSTKKFSAVEWSGDGQSLIENANYSDSSAQMEYKGIETWLLSDNGTLLTISRVDEVAGSKYLKKMVYEKQ